LLTLYSDREAFSDDFLERPNRFEEEESQIASLPPEHAEMQFQLRKSHFYQTFPLQLMRHLQVEKS
jgi:hypothetical protein